MKAESVRQTYKRSAAVSITETATIRGILLPLLALAAASILWLVSLPAIDPGKMTDLGLVSVLPVTYFISLGLIVLSYLSLVGNEHSSPLIMVIHLALLILIIHGTPQLVYGTIRYSWTWKHIGIIDYIQQHGAVDPAITSLSAYHNWPGFFSFAAFFNQVSGLGSSISYAGWGPVIFNLLDLAPLILIFKSLTSDNRVAWLGVLLFYLFSWIGQDYFSPQALAYFLYLVVIAIVIRWFRQSSLAAATVQPDKKPGRIANLYNTIVRRGNEKNGAWAKATPGQRVALVLTLVVIFFVIASSHQLTPWMLVSVLVLLVLFQVTDQRYLPVLMAVISSIWIIFMAVNFLDKNLASMVRSIGSIFDNVNGNLINLAIASPGQQLIANIDRLLSLFAWVLAGAGLFRRIRAGVWDLPAVLLAISPLPLLALNAYGGEMLFRVYLFGLPGIVFLAASFFFPTQSAGTKPRTRLLSSIVSLALIPGFLFSYYGKDRMYYFTPNEVEAAQYLFSIAPKGSLILDGTVDWPRQFTNYANYNYISIQDLSQSNITSIVANPSRELSLLMDDAWTGSVNIPHAEAIGKADVGPFIAGIPEAGDYPAAYLMITRSQVAQVQMTGILPSFLFSRIETELSQSSNFKVLISNSDVFLVQFIHNQEPG